MRPSPGAPARPIIAHLRHYGDCNAILGCSRELRKVQFQGNKISIYPDFTLLVQNARREFAPVKKLLMNSGHAYALLYPTSLRIVARGKPHIFTDPKLALKFGKKLVKEARDKERRQQEDVDHLLSDND